MSARHLWRHDRQRYQGGSTTDGSGSSLLAHIGSWWMGAVSSDPQDGQSGSPRSLLRGSSTGLSVVSLVRLGDGVTHLAGAREALGLLLGIDQPLVDEDVEHAAVSGLELALHSE